MSDEKKFVIITGMHRSGTSFVARSFNLAGLYLGNLDSISSHELKGTIDNKRGNWENTKIVELAEKTLESCGGKWYSPPENIKINTNLENECTSGLSATSWERAAKS